MAENEREQAIYDDMVGADHQRVAAPLPEAAAPNVDVEEGRRLLAEATEGPWCWGRDEQDDTIGVGVEDGDWLFWMDYGTPEANADLVCWMRNNLDPLLSAASPPAEDGQEGVVELDGQRWRVGRPYSVGDGIFARLLPAPTPDDPEEGDQ